MNDLVYFYPKQHMQVENCMCPGVEKYLPNILGPLNKAKYIGLKVKSFLCEFEEDMRQKIIDTPSRYYLIDLQDPFSLAQGEKIIRYCKYYHKDSKVFVVGRFAIDLYKQGLFNDENVDFFLSVASEEILCFLINKPILETKMWPDNNYKIHLGTYNNIGLDTFVKKSKVKRRISPRNIIFSKDSANIDGCYMEFEDFQDQIDSIETEAIKKIRIDREELNSDFDLGALTNKEDMTVDYHTNLFMFGKLLEKNKVEFLSERFKLVNVFVIGINEDVMDFINSIKSISNIKINVINSEFYISPHGKISTNIDTAQMISDIKDLKLRAKVKTIDEDVMLDYTDWELSQEVLQKIKKRF